MAAHLEGGHKGSVFQLLLAHGYVWSEAADGSRILWKPFVCSIKSKFLPLRLPFARCGNMKVMLWERKDVWVLRWLETLKLGRMKDLFGLVAVIRRSNTFIFGGFVTPS